MKQAICSFVLGDNVHVAQGDVFEDDDPVLKGRDALFTDFVAVETATAAPGEKRSTRRSTKKAAAKPKASAEVKEDSGN